ncbi:hypothetical protein JCM8208_001990 [Rhodotorula glutinis]
MAAASTKQSLLSLPISPLAPTYHLRPDPLFPSPKSLLALSSYDAPPDLGAKGPVALKEGDPVPPSMLRRSRQIRGGGAFTYTSPLPLEFPYDIREQADTERTNTATPTTIETQLASFEVSPQRPVWDAALAESARPSRPTAFSSARRDLPSFPRAELLSVSHALRDAWLPQLDVGTDAEGDKVREQFVDVVSGRVVLAREPAEDGGEGVDGKGFAPWSLCYAGHQFGSFAGQLGDGRAISILSTPSTEEVAAKTGYRAIELQLKGAGRTPYSRFADGLAVLRSSVREYLGAEAAAALGIPTSRALALVHLPSVHVRRESLEEAAIVTRVAGSWIRIGNFEQQAYRGEYDSLALLERHVARDVFALETPSSEGGPERRSLMRAVVEEVARRSALTVASWQATGFMHGVMNTDNIAVNGGTIDYGPYAWMDIFDPSHICNHSDDMGRYSFKNQPSMMLFAVDKLGQATAELIGHEVELAEQQGEAEGAGEGAGWVSAPDGWAGEGEGSEEMKRWRERGMAEVAKIKERFVGIFRTEYERLMSRRLGLTTSQTGDFDLFSRFLDLMALHELDFTNTHRLLAQFISTSHPSFPAFLNALLTGASSSSAPTAKEDWSSFLSTYEERLALEPSASSSSRRTRMDGANARFTLRQWVLEETIAKLSSPETRASEGKDQLERVLYMATHPFEAYGEGEVGVVDEGEACPTRDEQEKRRLCAVGPSTMIGFQCSCSS